MKSRLIDRQRRPRNEIIINSASELPTPTDTGDGLGLAYRLENKEYIIADNISISYPFVLDAAKIRSSGSLIEISYTGTGALFRNNSTSPIGGSIIKDIVFVGDGTNQAFNITDGLFIEFRVVLFRNFDMGTIQNINALFTTDCGIRLPKGTLNLLNISNRITLNSQAIVTAGGIGGEAIKITGNPKVFIDSGYFIPTGSDSIFNIDSGFTGTFDFSHSDVLGNENAFKSGGLDQTNIYVNVIAVAGVPDSQIIGSLYMERNTTVTNPTIIGETGTITAFADAGGGQVTVTSAGHGLSNGAVVWLLDDTYTGKYTISNVTTDTFEITATYSGTSTGTWETGWTKVAGTTYPMENERASMTDNNKITFANLEEQKVSIVVSTNPRNQAIAAAKNWEFAVMKNDVRVKGTLKYREMTDKAGEGVIVATESAISGDYFEVYTRNLSDTTTDMVMENMSIVIE